MNSAWVVFWTRRDETDRYVITRTESEAQARLSLELNNSFTVCGGYARIVDGSEPQWLDGSL